ncbi:MAG: diaminopimelate decarboxylase [Fervidicoccaceae archaeon]
MITKNERGELVIGGVSAEELAEEFGTPLYVYDEETMELKFHELWGSFSYVPLKILYAAKANSNIHILKIFRSLGAGLDAVSPHEVLLGRMASFSPESILFTGSSVSNEDMRIVTEAGAMINIDSFSQLRRFSSLFGRGKVSIRLNLGYGEGYHSYLVTGGRTKFGVRLEELKDVLEFSRENGIDVVGLHSHMGSGISDHVLFVKALNDLLAIAEHIDSVEFVDVGGGLGISYRKDDPSLDVKSFGKELSLTMERFMEKTGRRLELRVEPGRFLTAEAGILLVRVTDIKEASRGSEKEYFIGVDSGMGHLIRPALYGAYHEVVPAKIHDREEITAHVVGNYCESGDIIAKRVRIPAVKEGEILAIMNTGAYGYSMSSNYNLRPRPAEVLVRKGGRAELIRKRESFEDMIRTML